MLFISDLTLGPEISLLHSERAPVPLSRASKKNQHGLNLRMKPVCLIKQDSDNRGRLVFLKPGARHLNAALNKRRLVLQATVKWQKQRG